MQDEKTSLHELVMLSIAALFMIYVFFKIVIL